MVRVNKNSKLTEWQNRRRDGGSCKKCKNSFEILTVDHIIPVFFLKL